MIGNIQCTGHDAGLSGALTTTIPSQQIECHKNDEFLELYSSTQWLGEGFIRTVLSVGVHVIYLSHYDSH